LFRRGNTFSVRYNVPSELLSVAGKREIVKSLGTSDLKEALAKRRETLDDIRDTLLGTKLPAPKEEPKVPTVAETAHRWLVQSDGIKPSTKQKYRMILGSFEKFTGDCQVTKINRKLALEYIDYIQTKPSERTGERLSARAVGIRALIRKIEADEATATDIGNAVKVLISNRVHPKEPEGYSGYTNGIPETDMDFPVSF